MREQLVASWYAAAGLTATAGEVVVDVRADGAGGDVSGLIVTTTGGGTIVYARDDLPDPAATETDETGHAFLLDTPAGAATVTARAAAGSLCHLFSGGRGYDAVAGAVLRVTIAGACDAP